MSDTPAERAARVIEKWNRSDSEPLAELIQREIEEHGKTLEAELDRVSKNYSQAIAECDRLRSELAAERVESAEIKAENERLGNTIMEYQDKLQDIGGSLLVAREDLTAERERADLLEQMILRCRAEYQANEAAMRVGEQRRLMAERERDAERERVLRLLEQWAPPGLYPPTLDPNKLRAAIAEGRETL